MKHWFWLFALFGLASCATLPPDSQHANVTPELLRAYQQHSAQLLQFDQWSASGKLAFINPEQRQSSRVNWQHSPTQSHILLTNTLGITLLEAQQRESHATLEVDGKSYSGSSLTSLVAQLSGYRAPFEAMTQWLTGYANLAEISNVELDTNGYLLGFSQQLPNWGEWQVRYNGYYPATKSQPALPSRITLTHPNPDNPQLTIKLAISRWQSI
ncbi:lipoprotein insertase outer membrane protein LolB [Neiella marina]|uniref:Outer-membrane lipoprotein LolB n=1 Tax=Neiella holothuriorum TaxID=2870530 RepID=A0ABS7EHL2_9GAMM|nr:lipoprotein insertase outer membrane protein LolB [Neiella holothuriorum]MBW8191833.1 lipoprotein insertase outer membrane protein LolB [Neiella holothuriorum]